MLEQLNTLVWGSGLLVLLLGTGLFLSIRTRFLDVGVCVFGHDVDLC